MVLEQSTQLCVAPYILKEVEDCCVNEGEAGIFSCCASGNPLPIVSWYRDDEKIKESRQFTMLEEVDKTCCSNMFKYVLVISRSSPEFAGCYRFEAINNEGTVKSSANLYVKSSHIIQRKESTDVGAGGGFPDKQPVQINKEKVETYFTLLDELGRGKFGVVYKCSDNETKQEYAAKVSKCRSPSQRKVIENEINILNLLNHPLIIDMIAAFQYSRQYVIILELVSGGELFERLMEEELISEMDVIFYIKQLLRAVGYMHDKGILHLDLKPENIMLVNKKSTQIKLIDFSLACRATEGDSNKIMAGTREFVSPEVVNYDPVSFATDMWAVGVITYVLLACFTPFAGDTDSEISSNIMRCDWNCNDEVFDDISDEAKDFIATLIVFDPESRATSEECLQHSWFKSIQPAKKIKTAQLISFIAKKNWRKTIAAIRTTTFLARVASKCDDDCTQQQEQPSSKHENGDEHEPTGICEHVLEDLVVTEGFEVHEEKYIDTPNGALLTENNNKQLTWKITVIPIILPKFTIRIFV